jgi:hypothetical protein
MTRMALLLVLTTAATALTPLSAAAQATHGRPGQPAPPNTRSCTLSRSCTPGASIDVIPYVTTLVRNAGRLRLDVVPSQAEVYVDGVYAGHAEQFDGVSRHASMAPGAHRIEVRAEGYEDFTFGTRINRSQATVHRVTLSPMPGK